MRRRTFLRSGAVLLGGSTLVAACGNSGEEPNTEAVTPVGGTASSDVEVLNAVLELEHRSVAAYAAAAQVLRGEALAAGRRFGEQEAEHAAKLAKAVTELRGAPAVAKPADEYGFPTFEAEEDVLQFAVDLENTAVAAYIDAIPKLSTPDLRATAASIVTTEAEHMAYLLGALGKPQVPDAFVVGRKA